MTGTNDVEPVKWTCCCKLFKVDVFYITLQTATGDLSLSCVNCTGGSCCLYLLLCVCLYPLNVQARCPGNISGVWAVRRLVGLVSR